MVRNANFRRFHEQLKKLQIKRYLKLCGSQLEKISIEDKKYIGKLAHSPRPSNGKIYCNLQRFNGSLKDKLKIQERRANLDLVEENI